jgi:hypothetical protein
VRLTSVEQRLQPSLLFRLLGKHSTKKDDYLVTSVSIPPKPRTAIQAFDSRTQRDAFSITLGGLPGVRFRASLACITLITALVEHRCSLGRNTEGQGDEEATGRSGLALRGRHYLSFFSLRRKHSGEPSTAPRPLRLLAPHQRRPTGLPYHRRLPSAHRWVAQPHRVCRARPA